MVGRRGGAFARGRDGIFAFSACKPFRDAAAKFVLLGWRMTFFMKFGNMIPFRLLSTSLSFAHFGERRKEI